MGCFIKALSFCFGHKIVQSKSIGKNTCKQSKNERKNPNEKREFQNNSDERQVGSSSAKNPFQNGGRGKGKTEKKRQTIIISNLKINFFITYCGVLKPRPTVLMYRGILVFGPSLYFRDVPVPFFRFRKTVGCF